MYIKNEFQKEMNQAKDNFERLSDTTVENNIFTLITICLKNFLEYLEYLHNFTLQWFGHMHWTSPLRI